MPTDKAPVRDSEKFEAELWAELYTLRAAVKGPEGFTSWQDAAVDERMKRHAAERSLSAERARGDRLEAVAQESALWHVSLFGELQNALAEIEGLKTALVVAEGALTNTARCFLGHGAEHGDANYKPLGIVRAALNPTQGAK